MTLSPGKTLAHYEILGSLGAGAMGEVWRARDTRLGREVAVKVLPPHFANDDERLRRFEREAKTLASLNHPNVAQIYGVDEDDGTYFLALELVPGESLEERLKRRPLALEDALDIAIQIAAGLEAAHEAGVIHRDLKPANIRVTPEDKVKVLDFGLAKPMRDGKGSSTDSVHSTETGRLLGTPTYMAPEQARGKSIDKRVDIWAFGCVVYECLCGVRAFDGETLTDVLGLVLHAQPDLAKLPASTPREMRDLIERCIAKDPHQRLRDIGDARLALERIRSGAATEPATPTKKSKAAGIALAWAASAIALFAVGYALRKPPAPAPSPVVRSTLDLPLDVTLTAVDGSLAVSPDGATLVFVGARKSETPQLWLRALDNLVPRALTGTELSIYPFWSPDGRTIAFFADHKLKRIPASGGTVTTIAEAADPRGGAWGADNTIVFTAEPFGPLYRVSASGGTPTAVTKTEGRTSHRVPNFLPDGRRVLFAQSNSDKDGIRMLDLSSGAITEISSDASDARYIPGRGLVFARASSLMLQPFDLERGALTGEPRLLVERVSFLVPRCTGIYSAAADTLVYQSSSPLQTMEWFDLDGRSLGRLGAPDEILAAQVSPDGQRVAATLIRPDGKLDLWIYDAQRGLGTRVIESLDVPSASWSPDSRRLAYSINTGPQFETHVHSIDGSTDTTTFAGGWIASWSPDGAWVALNNQSPGTGIDIAITRTDGSEPLRVIAATSAEEQGGTFSPDGRWLLFSSDQSGRPELYVTAVPGPGPVHAVTSTGVGAQLQWQWLGDGRIIYLSSTAADLFALPTSARDGELDVGTPERLLPGRDLSTVRSVSMTSDGKRILMTVPVDDRSARALTLVRGWESAVGDP